MIKGIWQSLLVVSTPSAHLVEAWEITKDMTMSAKTIWYSLALPFCQVEIFYATQLMPLEAIRFPFRCYQRGISNCGFLYHWHILEPVSLFLDQSLQRFWNEIYPRF